jgi:hypothetical protein
MLKGGGLIELIGPLDPADAENGFVKMMKARGGGVALIIAPGALLTQWRGIRTWNSQG